MFQLPDIFYEINIFSVSLRLLMAIIFGGIIGLERGANKHPAGFRTHILVCVGAALAMLTNQYICEAFDYTVHDPARLGAQVITGVGFLGVGTILVTGRNKIKGLTTAAGLWASACLGLAVGIGFYSGAIIAAVIIFMSLTFLPKLENRFYRRSRVMDIYIEVDTVPHFKEITKYFHSIDSSFYESHILHTDTITPECIAFNISVILPKGTSHHEAVEAIEAMDGVMIVEDI